MVSSWLSRMSKFLVIQIWLFHWNCRQIDALKRLKGDCGDEIEALEENYVSWTSFLWIFLVLKSVIVMVRPTFTEMFSLWQACLTDNLLRLVVADSLLKADKQLDSHIPFFIILSYISFVIYGYMISFHLASQFVWLVTYR